MSSRRHLYPARIGFLMAIASIVLYFFFNIWPLAFSIGMAFTNAREDNLFVAPEVMRNYDNAIACASFMKTNVTLSLAVSRVFADIADTMDRLSSSTSALMSLVNKSQNPSEDPMVLLGIQSLYAESLRLRTIPGTVNSVLNCSSYGFATSKSLIEPRILDDLNNIYNVVSEISSYYASMSRDSLLSRLSQILELSKGASTYFRNMSSDFQGYLDNYIESVRGEKESKMLRFIGLDNFARLFTDPRFYYSLYKTTVFVATSVPLKLLLGIGLAFFYSTPLIYGRRVLRGLALAPWALPLLLSGLTWRFLFSPSGQLGRLFGIQLFTDEWQAFLVYNLFEAWLAYPFIMTVTMGALSGVSREVIEASYIDGASLWQRLRHVVLPLVSKPLMLAAILTTGASLQAFMVPLLLNGGGPTRVITVPYFGSKTGNVNEMIILFGYNRAITDKEWGYAAATYLIVVLIIMVYVAVWMYVSRRGGKSGL
ncbi:carbohydrate ABC transporter permease [Desulfurococcus mucosus]|uniref:Binding-protein-dependent transport systems inner membrane component n=1 Tax=Desulfurococcus mucosus (strain ATCC 35584 / DSM 2162 / JCM 9187 / O7/1) TaxID=765177 RepID=E8R710_DESM0|nr:sugar ABC transporter permease [Desulfurococcus mucosus]ADV64443.1 binding-protein-dependent transport systems inner membrane component [Desulfurococcus mucosus DSM 2162]